MSRWLILGKEFMATALAFRLQELEHHDVRVFCKKPEGKNNLKGIIKQVQSEYEGLLWLGRKGYVICEDEENMTRLRMSGWKTYGGNKFTEKMENDREFQLNVCKKAGLSVPNYHLIHSVEEGIKFIKSNPDQYVLKQMGDLPKTFNYVGREEDGSDVILQLEWMKDRPEFKQYEHGGFILEEFVEGIEFAIGAWWLGGDWKRDDDGDVLVAYGREHKKEANNDSGRTCGEMGTAAKFGKPNKFFEQTLEKLTPTLKEQADNVCLYVDANCGIAEERGKRTAWLYECFDEDTKILTGEGWKTHNDIKIGEDVLSINPSNSEIGWKRIRNKFSYQHNGEMLRFGSVRSHTALDALVTKEHKMLLQKERELSFCRADEIPNNNYKIVRVGTWVGKEVQDTTIPEYIEDHYISSRWGKKYSHRIKIPHLTKKISASAWMRFLGIYLAEGSSKANGQISISQSSKSKKRTEIEMIVRNLGFSYQVQKDGDFQLSSVQLVAFLKSIGIFGKHAHDKFVPREFKELSPRLLEDFLYGYYLGDGSIHHRTKQRSFCTTSPVLADDVQEILMKCGCVANIRRQKVKGTIGINGTTRRYDIFQITERRTKTDYSIDSRVTQTVNYSGIVWDVEVEDWHTLFVRRHGKAFFSGNCTPREGYPCSSLYQYLMNTETGDFFSDLIERKQGNIDHKKDWGVITVLGCGLFPDESKKNMDGRFIEQPVIIPQWENGWDEHIQPGYIRWDEKDSLWRISCYYEVVATVTHHGKDIIETNEKCVKDMKKIVVRAPQYRSDIGSVFAKKELPQLEKWGFV